MLGILVLGSAPVASLESGPDKQTTVVLLLDGLRWDSSHPRLTPHLSDSPSPASGRNDSGLAHDQLAKPLGAGHRPLSESQRSVPQPDVGSRERRYQKSLEGEFFGRGEPIWAAVARQGGISGVVGGWAGWRAADPAKAPLWRIPYAVMESGHDNRATLLLEILDQAPASRPDFIAMHFVEIDHEEHLHGVGSPQANAALRQVDQVIGALMSGLAGRGLDRKVNLVIVADHGMMNLGDGQVIFLEDYIDLGDLAVPPVGGGPVMALWTRPGAASRIQQKLLKVNPRLHVFRPGDVPADWNCCASHLLPPVLVTADPGWVVTTRRRADPILRGMHGYPNTIREMHALFIAAGPSIRAGVSVAPFKNVDVYSLLAALVKVEGAPNDGSIDSLCAILSRPPATCPGAR